MVHHAELRKLPSIDKLLSQNDVATWIDIWGHELVVEALRTVLSTTRQSILDGSTYSDDQALLARAQNYIQSISRPTLTPVINATGVILHTNLGRAPLSQATLDAMRQTGQGYSNLEFDLETGRRGSRYAHAEELLCRLTGAEGALLVNNNAGALLLVLSALASDREVIISRSQLVEIGGGFRIPDVMRQSHSLLREVGTTNRTYIRDYADAITEQTIALLRVHTSNFRVVGFTHQASLQDLCELASERHLWVLDDLGSGTLIDTQPFGLTHEPTVQESVTQGADLVTFSGDKLLGGPQAGIIIGKSELIARLKQCPLTRALRVDKTTIAGIQANLLHYIKGEALTEIPVWRMIAASAGDIERRARQLLKKLGPAASQCQLVAGKSMIGGGSLPEESLPSVLITIGTDHSQAFAAKLRQNQPPVIARIQDDRVAFDLRTVRPEQEDALVAALGQVL